MDLDQVGKTIGPFRHEYSWRDVILYHLGIGARGTDLDLVYEGAKGGLKVCPSYAVVTIMEPFMKILKLMEVDLASVLHAEQSMTMRATIPPKGALLTSATVANVYDKGKAAMIEVETETTDEGGRILFTTRAAIFSRGAGGWGGDAGPKGIKRETPADRKADFEVSQTTQENQAALYRLSGDYNPLHIDPALAKAAGFPAPILHGLCTFGYAARAVLEESCAGDVVRLKEFGARFTNPVIPGDAITTKGWKMDDNCIHLTVATHNAQVLSNAYALID